MRWNLKVALMRRGSPQWVVARQIGCSEARLSRIVSGRVRPTTFEAQGLCRILGVPEDVLFGPAQELVCVPGGGEPGDK